MFWYLQRDFLSLVREFSGGKLKQKGFFHSVWYWTDCVPVQTVLLGAVHFHVPARPAARQISYKWVAADWGNSICLCLTRVFLWPPRKPPWIVCIHFRDSYPIDVSHLNFNIFSVLLLQVSISVLSPHSPPSPSSLPSLFATPPPTSLT